MMRMTLSLRQETHDDECDRCREPKPSDGPCYSCGFEDAKIVLAGSLEAAAKHIDAAETARNERRKENT